MTRKAAIKKNKGDKEYCEPIKLKEKKSKAAFGLKYNLHSITNALETNDITIPIKEPIKTKVKKSKTTCLIFLYSFIVLDNNLKIN